MSLKESVLNIAPDFVVKFCAAPYVAGDSEEAAIQVANRLWQSRRVCSTIDNLGEELTTREEVEETIASYYRVLDGLKEQNFFYSRGRKADHSSEAKAFRITASK